MDHHKGATRPCSPYPLRVRCIQLPDAIEFGGTVVVRVATDVGNHLVFTQEIPEAIAPLRV